MNGEYPAVEGMSFGRFLGVLWRRLWVIIACLVLVPAAALLYTRGQEKQYSATAQVLLRDEGFEQNLAGNVTGDSSSSNQSPDTVFATNVGVAEVKAIAARTARAIDHGLTADRVAGEIAVDASNESNILSVKATDPDPQLAARIANVYSVQYIAFRRDLEQRRVRTAQARIDRQIREVAVSRAKVENRLAGLRRQIRQSRPAIAGPARQGAARSESRQLTQLRQRASSVSDNLKALKQRESELRDRAGSLATLTALQTGDAVLVQRAEPPSSPSSPNRARNLAAGIAIGLILGIVLAVLLELVDRRVRHPKEVETIFERPIIGTIPQNPALRRDGLRLSPLYKEPFRMLQANLRYSNGDRPVRSVLVTSAGEGDGKSTVAWNIGAAGADVGVRVLLIEADLRHSSFAARCGLEVQAGLTDVLSGRCDLAEVVHESNIGERGRGRNGSGDSLTTPSMHIVFAGPPAPNPGGLLASRRMSKLLGEAELAYDLVVIDTPPTPVVSDAIPLIKQVSGVIVVTRLGKNTREATAQLRD
ncbi:MAG TPA: Wzz/FepE/Etk N-terminal domain-containing protein, partial [Thermoleophilaceae bacterium]